MILDGASRSKKKILQEVKKMSNKEGKQISLKNNERGVRGPERALGGKSPGATRCFK